MSIQSLIDNAIDSTRINTYDEGPRVFLASQLIRTQVEVERRLREEERRREAVVRDWLDRLDELYGLQSAGVRRDGFEGPVLRDADGFDVVGPGEVHVGSAWFRHAFFRVVEITRQHDANIDALQECLSLLGRCIQTVFSQLLRPRFLFGPVVTQSPFFITHGNHPPDIAVLGRPTNCPGACAA